MRNIRLTDKATSTPAGEAATRYDKVRVNITCVYVNGSASGATHPKHLGDDLPVAEKIDELSDSDHTGGRMGAYVNYLLQVHLEKDGHTVWAYGEAGETFAVVGNRAHRIWQATKRAWAAEHAHIE